MELVEKYRLALLQLQQYSDNELIIQEGKKLNVQDELHIINPPKDKFIWSYSVSSNSIWASFDCGEVEAETYEEALELANLKLSKEFENANMILGSSFLTDHMTLDYCKDSIEISINK